MWTPAVPQSPFFIIQPAFLKCKFKLYCSHRGEGKKKKKPVQQQRKHCLFFRLAQLCKILPRTNHLSPQSVLENKVFNLNDRHIAHHTVVILIWKASQCITWAVFGAWLKTKSNLRALRTFILGPQSASKAFGFTVHKAGLICNTRTWTNRRRRPSAISSHPHWLSVDFWKWWRARR